VVRAGNKRFLRRKSSEEEPSCGLFPPVSALLQRSWVFTLPIYGAVARTMGDSITNLQVKGIAILCFSGWWFGTIFIFPYIGKNHPN